MRLTVGNVHTRVEYDGPTEHLWLLGFLTFDDNTAVFRKRAPRKRSLLVENLFPAGLTSLVVKFAAQNGITVNITDARRVPVARDPNADLRWLRPHQLDAVNRVCERGRGVLELPTGAGKTEIAVALRRALPCRWLFLVHRDVLRVQTVERFNLRAQEHGLRERAVMWSKDMRRPWEQGSFIVASFQGLTQARKTSPSAYAELLEQAEAICVDEAHVLPSDSFNRTCEDAVNAYYRVALSATPFNRGDRRSVLLLGSIGTAIARVSVQQLIDLGLLVQPRVVFYPHVDKAAYRKWSFIEKHQIVHSASRNDLVANIVRVADKPALVFVKQLDHVGVMQRALEKRGISCVSISGKNSDTIARTNALERLSRGDIEAIVCTVVLQEGVDVPRIASIVNAAGGKSHIGAIQRAGRALRPAPGKTGCTIFDVEDRGVPTLARHAAARRAAYVKTGYPVALAPTVARAPSEPEEGP